MGAEQLAFGRSVDPVAPQEVGLAELSVCHPPQVVGQARLAQVPVTGYQLSRTGIDESFDSLVEALAGVSLQGVGGERLRKAFCSGLQHLDWITFAVPRYAHPGDFRRGRRAPQPTTKLPKCGRAWT